MNAVAYSTTQVAAMADVSHGLVCRWIRAGLLVAHRQTDRPQSHWVITDITGLDDLARRAASSRSRPFQHGSHRRYKAGCQCEPCVTNGRRRERERKAAQRAAARERAS